MMHAMWVERLGWTLIHFLWQGVLIAAVYAAARRYAGRPDHRYLLACAALAAMMAAPLVTFAVMRPDVQISNGPVPVTAPLAGSVPSAASTVVKMLPVAAGAWHEQFLTWTVVVWLAGAIAFWMRLMGGWVVAARMRSTLVRPAPPEWQRTLDSLKARIGLSHPVRLLISALVQVPSVVGWIRPVVLVPIGALTGLPPEHMEALLLHELAHIRRRDYLVNMLQGVAESLLFYHPAVWWVSGHIRTERELCCDDVAVSAGTSALVYARALAEMESFRPAHFHTAIAANGGSLAHRIGRLLGQSPTTTQTLSGPGVAVCAALLAVTTCAVFGQSAAPRFEVASIKPCKAEVTPGARKPGRGGSSPVTLDLPCQTPISLIQWAYVSFANGHFNPLGSVPISGGPAWINSDLYQVNAKAAAQQSWGTMNGPMLRALLEDRFRLRIRHETRDVPVYVLIVARGGPRLRPSKAGSCIPFDFDRPLPPPERGKPLPILCGMSRLTKNGWDATGVTMGSFSRLLSDNLDRTVIDKTGIAGTFDVHLNLSAADLGHAGGSESATEADQADISFTVRTAVQKLGLKLESAKGPGEFLVVDHVERPTEN